MLSYAQKISEQPFLQKASWISALEDVLSPQALIMFDPKNIKVTSYYKEII